MDSRSSQKLPNNLMSTYKNSARRFPGSSAVVSRHPSTVISRIFPMAMVTNNSSLNEFDIPGHVLKWRHWFRKFPQGGTVRAKGFSPSSGKSRNQRSLAINPSSTGEGVALSRNFHVSHHRSVFPGHPYNRQRRTPPQIKDN